jgi:hypothetical protein
MAAMRTPPWIRQGVKYHKDIARKLFHKTSGAYTSGANVFKSKTRCSTAPSYSLRTKRPPAFASRCQRVDSRAARTALATSPFLTDSKKVVERSWSSSTGHKYLGFFVRVPFCLSAPKWENGLS